MYKRCLGLVLIGTSLLMFPVQAQKGKSPAAKTTAPATKAKLVEKVVAQPGKVLIPYEKYVMPNGLTVIIHEDHSDPLVHVDVTYHVGSAREEIGKSGFAHFFEHMMFQGSENVADEEHFKLITSLGGDLNGSTNKDRTNYFETVPSNALETMLWLEADRMGFLLPAVTQKKFEVQRATVKNERGQRYDNQPYGLVSEFASKNFYPYGHPYSWLTIGYVEDLNRVDVNDLKRFFLRWYGPNNAILTVGGDVTPAQVLPLVDKYFGSIPVGPKVEPTRIPAPVLEKDRYVSMEDNYIRFPMLRVMYPSVPRRHPDEVAIDCLADIIGGGANSILYKNLVKPQKALQARAGNPTYELAGEFSITVIPAPGQKLSDMDRILRESIKEFETRGVSDDDLKRYKATTESQMIEQIGTVNGKVSLLADEHTFAAKPENIEDYLVKVRALTKEQVVAAYNKYIKGKNSLTVSVVPKGKLAEVAAPDNYKIDSTKYKPGKDEYAGLEYKRPVDQNLDRAKKPKPGANPTIKVPDFWTDNFPNGIKVIGGKNSETPTVFIQLKMKGGQLSEQGKLDKAGIAALTATLMNEGTKSYTSEELESRLKMLGSDISVSAGNDGIFVNISSLTKNLDATLELAKEVVLSPRFAEDDFLRVYSQGKQGFKQRATNAGVVASEVARKLLYGPDHIFGYANQGTEKTYEGLTLDDVKAYYAQWVSPAQASLVVMGDIDQSALLPKLGWLKNWSAKPITLPALPKPAAIVKTKVYLVDKPNAAQSEIRIQTLVDMPYDLTGDYYRAVLANFTMGGDFNSRINLNLREDKGWTYGARSGFSGNKYYVSFGASASVKASATDSSVFEFMKEIKNFVKDGCTAEELTYTKNSIGQSEALNYESLGQKAGFLSTMQENGLTKEYVAKQNAIIASITQNDVKSVMQKYLNPEKLNIVVVGDKATVLPGLQRLGYEVVELDKDANPVK